MYEPKYKLNKKDAARYNELLTRHCCEAPFIRPGVPRTKPNRKFPPLNAQENAEFEALSRKRHRKIASHPKVQASIAASRRANRRLGYLVRKLERMMEKARRIVKNKC